MPECPNECGGQRFIRTVTQAKQVIVNERGETISCQGVGEPTISKPRCTGCGAEVVQDE